MSDSPDVILSETKLREALAEAEKQRDEARLRADTIEFAHSERGEYLRGYAHGLIRGKSSFARAEQAERERDEAREALRKYAKHQWTCGMLARRGWDDSHAPICSCGLAAVLGVLKENPQ